MTIKARIMRLEERDPPEVLQFRRCITCTVRQWSIDQDYRAALEAAGLEETDGDIVRLVLHEYPVHNEPRDPNFVPQVLGVRGLG